MLALCKCFPPPESNTRRLMQLIEIQFLLNPPNPLPPSGAGWGGERGREAVKHVTARLCEIRRAAQTWDLHSRDHRSRTWEREPNPELRTKVQGIGGATKGDGQNDPGFLRSCERWLKRCEVKVSRTVLRGGKVERLYLSWLFKCLTHANRTPSVYL